MVHDILAMPQGKINNVHAVHLTHVLIPLSTVDVFRHQLRHAEQHTLEIGILIVVLHLDEYQFPFGIQGQQIHTVILVELVFLIAFALQQLADGDFLIQKRGQQSFQHTEIGLVAQQALHRPIKTDIVCHKRRLYCNIFLQI